MNRGQNRACCCLGTLITLTQVSIVLECNPSLNPLFSLNLSCVNATLYTLKPEHPSAWSSFLLIDPTFSPVISIAYHPYHWITQNTVKPIDADKESFGLSKAKRGARVIIAFRQAEWIHITVFGSCLTEKDKRSDPPSFTTEYRCSLLHEVC